MSNVGLHQTAKTDAHKFVGLPINRDIGSWLKKASTAWVLNDIQQKPARTCGRAVLIVDLAVHVTLVSARNQRGCLVLFAFRPQIYDDVFSGFSYGETFRVLKGKL